MNAAARTERSTAILRFSSFILSLKSQWFSLAMLGLLGVAWAWPQAVLVLNPGEWTKYGAIVLIFFLSGLSLKPEEALHGLKGWRVHVFIQVSCYAVFPALCWGAMRAWGGGLPEGLVIGFYLLAVLPTTITSCVVFTQLAGGNFAAALFNAVGGNMLGVFLSPVLLLLLMGASDLSLELDVVAVFVKLGLLVLAPLCVGQVVHQLARESTAAFRTRGGLVNKCCILLIVFFAFCGLFLDEALVESAAGLLVPLSLLVPVHFLILGLAKWGAKSMGFERPDYIAIMFCAPQKTLALGIPLVNAVLADRPDLAGLACLPVIVYHPVQLLVAGFLVERYKKGGK